MSDSDIPGPSSDSSELLATVLQPLLEDFQHLFGRSLTLFEAEPIGFLLPEQQHQLVDRIKTALAETQTAQTLLRATDGQVGVEATKVLAWHTLVSECWSLARRLRLEKAAE
ncbi:MAG TPA: DUF2605 domain-containing protein [Trichocoleus sp.]